MLEKQIFKTIGSVIYYLLFVVVVIVAILAIISSNKIGIGYKVFSVQSGSMKPTIYTGDLIIVKDENNYNNGDVITFQNGSSNGNAIIITHRIINIKSVGETQIYQTKGDYNSVSDVDLIPKSNVIGKYVFRIPLLGYIVTFARTIPGFMLLIVVPATIIIYDEFNKIRNVWKKENKQTI